MNSHGFGNPPTQRRLRHLKCIFIRNLVADPTSDPSLGAFYYTLHAHPREVIFAYASVKYGQRVAVEYFNSPEIALDIDNISLLSPETATRSQNGISNKQSIYPTTITNNTNNNTPSNSTPLSLSSSSTELPPPPSSLSISSESLQPNGHTTTTPNTEAETSENVPPQQDGQPTTETENGNDNLPEAEERRPRSRTSPDLYRGSPTNEESVNEDDVLPSPFYTSEVVTNTCNPTWRHLDCSRFHLLDIVDIVHSFNICVWSCQTTDTPMAPVMQLEIELADLEFIGNELRQIGNYVFPQNSVIFEMRDGLYVTRETRDNMRPSRGADVKPAAAPDKRKAATCNQFAFVALIAKKRGLIQAQEKGRQLSETIEGRMADHATHDALAKQRNALKLRIAQLKEECAAARQTLKSDSETLRATRTELLPRAKVLGKAQIELLGARQQLANQETKALDKQKDNLAALQHSYEFRRWYLVSQIRTIYTIQQSVDGKSLSVNGFRLPNSDFAGCDEEQIATALGYVSHILCLASNYLEVPLRYPMIPMCSRSMIIDEISQQTSPKFPLYSRGVDRTRFDYAVFLLNKNLEQLLNSQGLEIVSLRHTLPNVQILLAKVENNCS